MVFGIKPRVFYALDVGNIIQIDDGTQVVGQLELFRRGVIEENMISWPEKPVASDIISSVAEEQSVPHPYSCRIFRIYGFGVAFTAKYPYILYSRKRLFLNVFAFSRIPFSSYR